MRHLTLLTFLAVCMAVIQALPAVRESDISSSDREGRFLVYILPETLAGFPEHEKHEYVKGAKLGLVPEEGAEEGERVGEGEGQDEPVETLPVQTECIWPLCFYNIQGSRHASLF